MDRECDMTPERRRSSREGGCGAVLSLSADVLGSILNQPDNGPAAREMEAFTERRRPSRGAWLVGRLVGLDQGLGEPAPFGHLVSVFLRPLADRMIQLSFDSASFGGATRPGRLRAGGRSGRGDEPVEDVLQLFPVRSV